jgi:hypothetical protein
MQVKFVQKQLILTRHGAFRAEEAGENLILDQANWFCIYVIHYLHKYVLPWHRL